MKELEKTYKCSSCGKFFVMRPVKDDPYPVPCIYCSGTADLIGAKMKECPVCKSTKWDYDVIAGDHTFCGGCYWYLTEEIHQNNLKRPVNKRDYKRLLSLARTAKAENRIY